MHEICRYCVFWNIFLRDNFTISRSMPLSLACILYCESKPLSYSQILQQKNWRIIWIGVNSWMNLMGDFPWVILSAAPDVYLSSSCVACHLYNFHTKWLGMIKAVELMWLSCVFESYFLCFLDMRRSGDCILGTWLDTVVNGQLWKSGKHFDLIYLLPIGAEWDREDGCNLELDCHEFF